METEEIWIYSKWTKKRNFDVFKSYNALFLGALRISKYSKVESAQIWMLKILKRLKVKCAQFWKFWNLKHTKIYCNQNGGKNKISNPKMEAFKNFELLNLRALKISKRS